MAPTEDQQPDPTANGTLVTAKSHNANDAVSSVTGVEVMVVQRNPDRVTRRPKELLVKVTAYSLGGRVIGQEGS